MQNQGSLLLFSLLLCSLSLFAQDKESFNIDQFKYSDVHVHSSIKPFNSRKEQSYSIWEPIDHSCEGEISKLFVKGSKDIPKFSQCHFEALAKGGVNLCYLSLTPLEKKSLDPKLLNTNKKGISTFACVGGVKLDVVIDKKDIVNYYEDLSSNIQYIIDGQSQGYRVYGQNFQYEIVRSAKHLEQLQKDNNKIGVVLTIEGGHSLGLSLEPLDISSTDEYQKFYLDNVRRIKGTLPLKEGGDQYLEYPILSINLNHFFWNGLAGHCRTFNGLQNFVFGQNKGLDEGLTELGKKTIKLLLDKKEGRRILIDVKHMSLDSRLWYYNYVDSLRAVGDSIPIFSSHTSIAGLSMQSKEYLKKDKKGKNKNSYLNTWKISLADEDIQAINRSNGLIGIMLDKNKLIGELTEKALNKTIEGSAQRRTLYAKVIWANVFACIKAVGNESAWDNVCIGSDFDGMVAPFEHWKDSRDFPSMAKDLYLFLKNPSDIFGLYSKEEVQKLMFDYSPEEIIEKIMSSNARNFTLRNL